MYLAIAHEIETPSVVSPRPEAVMTVLAAWTVWAAFLGFEMWVTSKFASAAGNGVGSLMEKYTYQETVKTVLEEDNLPDLPDMLEDLGLRHRLEDFYRKHVFEVKYVLTLKDMDLRLMGLNPEEIEAVKKKSDELRVEREITATRLHPLLEKRNSLSYGRLFLDGSLSSFEFYLASFGPPAPLHDAPLVWADPRDACSSLADQHARPSAQLGPPTVAVAGDQGVGGEEDGAGALGQLGQQQDLSEQFVLALRGSCSFVDKANNLAGRNASAVIVVNSDEDLFRVSASLGGRGDGEDPEGPANTAMVLVRSSALLSLSKAMEWGRVTARLVPLSCRSGRAACEGVLPEEQGMHMQVDSGFITTEAEAGARDWEGEGVGEGEEENLEFLSATFGATLPGGAVLLVEASPANACGPLLNPERGVGAAVLVRRGGCSFGDKAVRVQAAGGRVMIVSDNGLGVLQNVGAMDAQAKKLFMPAVFVTARAGDWLSSVASRRSGPRAVRFSPDNSVARSWADLGSVTWPEDPLEQRVLARQLKATHDNSSCRSQWVTDKAQVLQGSRPRVAQAEVFENGEVHTRYDADRGGRETD
ncbi:unnamed protein product [Discosporangium mesarthrocarpum]